MVLGITQPIDFVKAVGNDLNPLVISTILCYFYLPRELQDAHWAKNIIIENEQDAAEMFAEMMRFSGFRVLTDAGSSTAISTIDRQKPAAVILDIMMPGISGLEVLRYMRREPEMAKIPVVVVSAKSKPTDIQTGLKAGASVNLTKPVSYLDLKGAAKKVLSA